jgi:hypothetical protein
LAEAHAKMKSSNTVDLDKIDAEEATCHHCATDLLSGKNDVSSETTGMSDNSRKQRHQEEESDSSKKLATDATGQDHIAQGPKTGKGKAGHGLKAKNAKTFGKKVQDNYGIIPDLLPTGAGCQTHEDAKEELIADPWKEYVEEKEKLKNLWTESEKQIFFGENKNDEVPTLLLWEELFSGVENSEKGNSQRRRRMYRLLLSKPRTDKEEESSSKGGGESVVPKR